MEKLKTIYNKINGYKTFLVALCGLVYGIGTGDLEIILASLAIFGFRDAMNK